MKKRLLLLFGWFALLTATCFGVSQNIEKASAYSGISGPTIQAEFDSSSAVFYSSDVEQTSVTVSEMDTLNDDYFTFDDANASLEEVSANRCFRATLLPVRFYVNLDAHTEVTFAQFSLDAIAYKTLNNAGGAYSITELFSAKPTVINGNANTNPSDENSLARSASYNTSKAHAYYHIDDYTFTNNSSSNQNIYLSGTYYVAYIIKYAASYDHVGAAEIGVANAYCTKVVDLEEPQINIDFDDENAKYYQQSGSDLSTINTSSLVSVPNENNIYTSEYSSGLYIFKEASANRYFDIILIPFRFYVSVDANDTVSYSDIHVILTIRKMAPNGTAGAFVELFEGEPTSINTSSNDTVSLSHGILRKSVSSCSGNIVNISDRNAVECNVMGESFVNSTNEAKNIYSSHTYYLMFGCRYASAYDHQAEATVNVSGTIGEVTNYQCRIGTTYYESLQDCLTNVASSTNSPISLLSDITTSNASFPLTITRRTYLNLNGYTINAGSNVALSVSYALDLYGNGTISSSAVHTIETTQTILLTSGSDVTIRNDYVGVETSAAYYQTSNSFTMWSGTIIGGDYGVYFTGNVIYINGGTITGTVYDVYSTRGIALSGATTSVEDICINGASSMKVVLYSGSSYYTNTSAPLNITYGDGSDINTARTLVDNIANADVFAVINIVNDPATYFEYYYNTDAKNYVCRYIPRDITFNGTNCTFDGASTGTYGSQYAGTIHPIDGYTYPASVEILINSDPIASNKYNYNSTNGRVTIYINSITDSVTINAVAVQLNYDITFSSNGGSGSIDAMSGTYNETISLPTCTFANNYHTFLEWNTSSEGSGDSYDEGDDYTVIANATIYAIWYQTNENKVDEFVATYMHLNDYTESEGRCLGNEGYYAHAKEALIDLGDDCITLFRNNASYSDAKERYETWASFNSDTAYMYEDTPVNPLPKIIHDEPQDNNMIIEVSLVALLSISFAFFYLRMRANKR